MWGREVPRGRKAVIQKWAKNITWNALLQVLDEFQFKPLQNRSLLTFCFIHGPSGVSLRRYRRLTIIDGPIWSILLLLKDLPFRKKQITLQILFSQQFCDEKCILEECVCKPELWAFECHARVFLNFEFDKDIDK